MRCRGLGGVYTGQLVELTREAEASRSETDARIAQLTEAITKLAIPAPTDGAPVGGPDLLLWLYRLAAAPEGYVTCASIWIF